MNGIKRNEKVLVSFKTFRPQCDLIRNVQVKKRVIVSFSPGKIFYLGRTFFIKKNFLNAEIRRLNTLSPKIRPPLVRPPCPSPALPSICIVDCSSVAVRAYLVLMKSLVSHQQQYCFKMKLNENSRG